MPVNDASVYQLAEMNRGAAEAVFKRAQTLYDNVFGPAAVKGDSVPQAFGLAGILDATREDLQRAEHIINLVISHVGEAGEGPRGSTAPPLSDGGVYGPRYAGAAQIARPEARG